ncbi:MAG TPA: DNA polymerase III subunit alpha, partial [Cytophagales bacterium]|nr:DNA polymerase III subunit alpha [Cytophagales bacterium]
MQFSHLHCHTQFSLLDGAANIASMMKKAKEDNMPAVAITDHGNMFGAFQFVAEAAKAGVKPIVGCEFYMVNDRHKKQFTKEDKDQRCHQLFLAKNAEGYKNLIKMCSLGLMEGMYGKYPRIDKELVLKYHKGLIATTCCIGAEVPRTILRKGEEEGEKVFKWWLDLFGDDYYVELQRHDIPEQKIVNEVLIKFAIKHNVKIIASNDSHYVDQKDWNAHDILLCINTGEKQSTPTMKEFSDDEQAFKGKRFAFYNDQFYFKTTKEMSQLFSDVPQAIDNTNEIVDKVETLKLKKDILLPAFPIPKEFQLYDDGNLNQWEYLRHLTFEGAKQRYGEIDAKVQERLDFELFTIKTMGFAGYFLIVGDFIQAGRNIGVFVGPGRGSAAGSAVAYCIGITNIDPIKYDLLFERFLNPDRKSMPDIDTDFDDEGRQKVIDYVVDKYGKNQVAQIVTYGTMAAKMSIKDVARVLDLPLQDSNGLAKLVPDKPGISLNRVLHAPLTAKEGEKSLEEKEGIDNESLQNVKQLREIYQQKGTLASDVLHEAEILEGSVRGTGIHAAGIIIAPSDLSDLIPVAVAKDSDLLVTQFEGKVIEDAGVIKMDFLGLKTLTIIKNTLKLIKKNKGVDINIDDVDLEDMKTFELFQRGETEGVFQFESPGMKKYMKELKPDKFGDIIAMNALYRPGPIAYIPNYINRKHGREEITYDLPEMEEYLKDTYGITVYQEQVMLLSQKLAGFTKGQADVLRKAMGKKDRKTLDALKETFLKGAQEKGHPSNKLEKIWTDWEAFAQYAFNKSHSTCYAFVAFQTAWLKTHYPSEYMAANLTNEKDNIEKVTYFLEETKRMGIKVLGPNVNKSDILFDVDADDNILFGLGGIKG